MGPGAETHKIKVAFGGIKPGKPLYGRNIPLLVLDLLLQAANRGGKQKGGEE